MPTTTGHFQNQYTFSIVDDPGGYESATPLIELNAIAVVNYLSDFISWNGTLDFQVRFGDPFMFGHNGTGLLPALGGIAADNHTIAASEAFTGIDANGTDGDAGAWILPNANGSLTNYGTPLYLDPSPDPYEAQSPPVGMHDFFSIYLHEVLHSLGFWSVAQHGPVFGASTFDSMTREDSGTYYFTGAQINALLGQDLRLAQTGSRDHYSGVDGPISGFPFIDRGSVFEFGNYEQNRWHLGQVELAVLADLGWTVANQTGVAVVELADNSTNLTGDNVANSLFGDHHANVLSGLAGNDALYGNQGDDTLDGGADADTMAGGAGNDAFVVDNAGDVITELAGQGDDTIRTSVNYDMPNFVERIVMTGTGDVASNGNDLANYMTGNSGHTKASKF